MSTTETTTRPSENTITRRKMLKSVAAASLGTVAAIAVSENSALAEATQHPASQIRVLSRRISDLIKELPEGFFDHIEIEADHVYMAYADDAATKGDAELIQLAEAWRRQYDRSNANPMDCEDVADDPEFQALVDLENQIAAITPTTAKGFSAKLLILTHYGAFAMDGVASSLYRDATRVAALTPPDTMIHAKS